MNEDDEKLGNYGAGVRSQVLEVVVRQAIAGAPWREICAGPMKVNNISEQDVEEILRKRGGGGAASTAQKPKSPTPDDWGNAFKLNIKPSEELKTIREELLNLLKASSSTPEQENKMLDLIKRLQAVEIALSKAEQSPWSSSELNLQVDLERELARRPPIQTNQDPRKII